MLDAPEKSQPNRFWNKKKRKSKDHDREMALQSSVISFILSKHWQVN